MAPLISSNWSMLLPVSKQEIASTTKKTLELLSLNDDSGSKKKTTASFSSSYKVYCRKSRFWCGDGGQSYRVWLVTFVLGSSSSSSKGHDQKYTVMCDIGPNESSSQLTGDMILAALARVLVETGSSSASGRGASSPRTPGTLVLWPNISTRLATIQRLQGELQASLSSCGVTVLIPSCTEVEEHMDCHVPVLVNTTNDDTSLCKETLLYQRYLKTRFREIEGPLQALERTLPGGGDNEASVIWQCMTDQKVGLSVGTLKTWFQATARFHTEQPWKLLTNFTPLIVNLPKCTLTGGKPRTYFCVVVGNGSWDARGVIFHNTWQDLFAAMNTSQYLPPDRPIHHSQLFYYGRRLTPFTTLDHVDALNLDCPRNDGTEGGDSFPMVFSPPKVGRQCEMEEYLGFIGKLLPDPSEIPLFSLVLHAICDFTRTVCHEQVHPADGSTRTAFCASPGQSVRSKVQGLDIDVQWQQLDYEACKYAPSISQKHMATMSVGATDVCNFCQKPETIVRKEESRGLSCCGRCKRVRYCSRRCQRQDWKRHKVMECWTEDEEFSFGLKK